MRGEYKSQKDRKIKQLQSSFPGERKMNEERKVEDVYRKHKKLKEKNIKKLTWPFKEKKISMIRLIHSFIRHSL